MEPQKTIKKNIVKLIESCFILIFTINSRKNFSVCIVLITDILIWSTLASGGSIKTLKLQNFKDTFACAYTVYNQPSDGYLVYDVYEMLTTHYYN